ncbi:hypothetical protein [Reyranella sp.]|uniref:hypothetical protein n=1 Tax=Reyranella sp. TaxID=1929291 RepID=UPI00378314DA
MGLIFKDDLHDRFGTWPLAYSRYSGGELGELQAIARAVGDGDDAVFQGAWSTAADALEHEAALALAKGRRAEARELLLRASCFFSIGYRPLFGKPKMTKAIESSRQLRWSIVQRGFWVNGVDSLRDYLQQVERFTVVDRVERIACPTLIARAENDPIADTAEALFEALTCPKTLIRFGAQDGADGHCEMGNRSLLNRRVLDWLDEVFAV